MINYLLYRIEYLIDIEITIGGNSERKL